MGGHQRFVGVDIETTGLSDECAIIELGLACASDGILHPMGWLVRPNRPFLVEPEAMGINGIDMGEVFEAAPPQDVETAALMWLDDMAGKYTTLIATGFNVGSFDMVFLKREMPRLAERFSYRCLELNSAIFAATGCSLLDFEQNRDSVMREMMRRRNERTPHRAASDAMDALMIVEILQERGAK